MALATMLSLAQPAQALKIIEPFGSYQPQVSCDPSAKSGVVAFRDLIHRRFGGGDLGIVRSCATGGLSEHKEGRAWDYALNWHKKSDRRTARQVIRWLTQPVAGDPARRAKRLGIMYLIWNKQIWSAYRAEDGLRPYTGASPHRDHIHFSFTWNGATKRTSWWTGKVMPMDYGPCQRWNGELAPKWKKPRLKPCPVPIDRPKANKHGIYKAQHGETVRRVARFFKITGKQVRVWNGFPRKGKVELYVGQRIRVTKPGTIPPISKPPVEQPPALPPAPDPWSPPVDPGDEPGEDRDPDWGHDHGDRDWERDWDRVQREPEPPSTDEGDYYVVEAGDTLWRIAYNHNTTVEELMILNGLTTYHLAIGQRLRVR